MIRPWEFLPSLGKLLAISLIGQNYRMRLLDGKNYWLRLNCRAVSLWGQNCCLHLSEGKLPSASLCSRVPIMGRLSAMSPNRKARQLYFSAEDMSAQVSNLNPRA